MVSSFFILTLKFKIVNKNMVKFIKIRCKNCNKIFLKDKGHYKENIKFGHNFYCSRKCEYKYKTKRKTLICENCGKRFSRAPNDISPHNYCSRSCAAIVNNRKNPKRKPKFKVCLRCSKQFRKSTGNIKYCSMKCRGRVKPKHARQKLINIIRQKVKELQRIPARREMKESKTCQKNFGSWNNAIIAAGFHPNRSHSQRMYKRTNTKALDGHLCDSVSEALIDNWLTKNKISHERDVSYPETNHKADWSIFVERKKIFIEYFGLANDSPRYDRTMKEKKGLCRKNKISLIAILPQDLYPKEFFEKNLKNKFKKFLVV